MPLTDILVMVLSISIVQCSEQELSVIYVSDNYWKNETPLQCYHCNSQFDPRCGDPFNSYSIGTVNCSERDAPEHLLTVPGRKLKPTVCRKIVQKVEGRKWVIRECGYIMDAHDDKNCIRRTGTKDIEVQYCACTKSLCNDCSIQSPSVLSLSFILFVVSITRLFSNC